jgi:hypothetical protein
MSDITNTEEIRPFRIEVSNAELEDLRDQLVRTRWPDELPWASATTRAFIVRGLAMPRPEAGRIVEPGLPSGASVLER